MPAFVEYLSLEIARFDRVHVLAPHSAGASVHERWLPADGSGTDPERRAIEVFRFRYFIESWQRLANNGGILANLARNPLKILLVPPFLLAQLVCLLRLHRRHRYDLVHAHWIIPQGMVAVLARLVMRRKRRPVVLMTSHGSDLQMLKSAVLTSVKRRVLRSADRVTVVSPEMRTHCESLGIDARKVAVMPMGVDLSERFTPGGGDLKRNGIIFVGRLVEEKGSEHLLHAMVYLVERRRDLRLRIIGDGPLKAGLQRLAGDLRLTSNVEFLDAVANERLPDYYRTAEVAVVPSLREGLGLVAIEAMGCACGVVASDLPALRDFIEDGTSGFLAEPANPRDLGRKIATLLNDVNLRQRIGEAGRRSVCARFDWREVGRAYADLIDETCR